jgi:hypothetical protein
MSASALFTEKSSYNRLTDFGVGGSSLVFSQTISLLSPTNSVVFLRILRIAKTPTPFLSTLEGRRLV